MSSKQHDGAAARHRLERPGQRPASGDVGIGGDDIPRLGILDFREDHPAARRRNRPAADAGGDDVARACAALHQVVGQVHHFAEAVIHDGKPPVGGEHAQAVGHVVQGGVELAGQRRFPETRGHRLHKDGMKAEVDAFQADEEQHQQHGEAEVVEPAMQRQRKRQWPARKKDMQLDDRRTAVISRRAARRIGDRHGDAEHMRERIIDAENGHETPKPKHSGLQHGAEPVARLKIPRLFVGERLGTAFVSAHLECAVGADSDDQERARPQQDVAGLERRHQRGGGRADRAHEHGPEILAHRIDQSRI